MSSRVDSDPCCTTSACREFKRSVYEPAKKYVPGALLYDSPIEVGVASIEQLWITEAVGDVRATELRHLLKLTQLVTECDVSLVGEFSIAVDCNGESDAVEYISISTSSGARWTYLSCAAITSRICSSGTGLVKSMPSILRGYWSSSTDFGGRKDRTYSAAKVGCRGLHVREPIFTTGRPPASTCKAPISVVFVMV